MSSIRQIFDSILLKHFKKSITILPPETAVKKPPQKKTPLPISSGLPERFPIYRSFFHLFFPRNYDRVYERKREFLQMTKDAPLPDIAVSPEIKALIIRSSVTELLKLLNEDEITSQQLVFTYMERAQQIGIDMNYITDLNIEEAFEDARRCDEIRANTPYNQRDKLGLLFGIPISVKENILQRGFDSTCGLATRCFMPSKKDSIAVELLRKEGAIPFARSTVPQLLSVIETISHIWGRANNPWDETRSTGGSSGGEAGLISMALSPIGLGTDGMGSLRIPASWCGIYSFKPTSGRPSWKGSMALLNYLSESRWNVLYPGIGPMGRTVDDLILVTKALCQKENKEADPALPFVEWRQKEMNITKKLKLGYVLSEEMYGSSKAARRAVLEAVEEFRRQGHEVEEIRIPNFNDIVRMALSLTTSEGSGRGNILALNGESLIYEMRSRMGMLCIPRWLRRPFLPLLRLLGEERAAFLGNWTAGLNGDQWVWILHEKDHIQQRLFNFWKEKELDAIITPTTALPALHHGNSGELSMNICYVWVANMFNLPTGVVPITRVQEGEDYYGEEDSVHRDLLYRLGVKSMKGSVGLPMSIQVMTMPYEDEKCLGIMKLLEDRFPAMIKM